jgi:hypothetical protein
MFVVSEFPNILVRLVIVAGVAACMLAASLPANAQTPVATITSLVGQVEIDRSGKAIPLGVGGYLEQGDRIATGPNGRASVVFSDHSEMEVGESTVSTIDEHAAGATGQVHTRIGLLSGVVRTIVNATAGPADFSVRTPNAVSAVRGTRFDTAYTGGAARGGYGSCHQFTDVAVYEGVVAVSNVASPSTSVQVPAGYETTVACSAAALPPGPTGVTGSNAIGAFAGTSPALVSAPSSSVAAVSVVPAPVPPCQTVPPPPPPPPPPPNGWH